MKRFLFPAALAAIILLCALPAAGAAADKVSVTTVEDLAFGKELVFGDPFEARDAFTLENAGEDPVDIVIEVLDQGTGMIAQTAFLTLPGDGSPITVQALVYRQLTADGDLNTYRVRIASGGGFEELLYFAQKLTVNEHGQPVYRMIKNSYYPGNTVCSFGPHFRDLTPRLTDDWYTFTPVDLSVQGRQTFPLTASNMYVIGEAHVDVFGDQFFVTYSYFHAAPAGTTVPREEFIAFFNAYDDITSADPGKITSRFAFGVPYSVSRDLGNDSNVLMFICNRANYFRFPIPTQEYPRMRENLPEYSALRERMLLMMDPITAEPR